LGVDWTIAAFAACLAVLVLYSLRFGSALGVLVTLVLVACLELAVRFATAAADTCGSSQSASALQWSGVAVLLVGIGGFGAHRRRILPVLAAVVVAGAWVALVAYLVPGGTGGCFE
jgi:hypothetical protein